MTTTEVESIEAEEETKGREKAMSQTVTEDGIICTLVESGAKFNFNLDSFSDIIVRKLALFGLKRKISNFIIGCETDDERLNALQEGHDLLIQEKWSAIREPSGAKISKEKVKTLYSSLDMAGKEDLAKTFKDLGMDINKFIQ